MRTISAADANRHFSKLLRQVKAGETVVITSHGEPVARMAPAAERDAAEAAKERARGELVAHLRSLQPMNIPITWTRDDIYEDDF
jgi:prevent-host-death family protein